MKYGYFKYKNILGLGIMEIMFALAIMMIITPAVLKFAFTELYEVKYINIAKQLKMVEKSLLNFTSIEKNEWKSGSKEEIKDNVRNKFMDNYGLDPRVSTEITDEMVVVYVKGDKDTVNEGVVEVYAVINMDFLGFDEMAFKKTLLYAGDTVGYEEGGTAYSITGVWSEPFENLTSFVKAEQIAVVKIDDADMEDEYTSSYYLYRNTQGGPDGATMGDGVNLDLGGNDIKEFGTVMPQYLSFGGEKAQEVQFSDGVFGGIINVSDTIVLEGKLLFNNTAKVITYFLEFGNLGIDDDIGDTYSELGDFIVSDARLTHFGKTFRAIVEVGGNEVGGNSNIAELAVQNMEMDTIFDYLGKSTEVRINTSAPGTLNLDIATSDIDNLSTQTVSVKNGFILSSDRGFSTENGNINVTAKNVYILDACHNVGSCISSVNVNAVATVFGNAITALSRDIENMKQDNLGNE